MKFKFLLSNSELESMTASAIKQHELKLGIVELLYRTGQSQQLEISKTLKASLPTINKAIMELIDDGLVIENGYAKSKGGRKPGVFTLCKNSFFIISISIEREKAKIALMNAFNEFVSEILTINTNVNNESIIELIYNETETLIKSSGVEQDRVVGVGVALSGLIDKKTGISYSNITFSDKPISELFANKFKIPVFVDNDARVVALGELLFGQARGSKNALCISLGSATGMGIIINGRLYDGNSGFAGEFGHIPISENGELCYCGNNGCLETITGGKALREKARKAILDGEESFMAEWCQDKINLIDEEMILNAVLQGDKYAISLLAEVGEALGKGMVHLIHLFNPDKIVLGGTLSQAQYLLLKPLKLSLEHHVIARMLEDTDILLSQFNANADLIGALALVMEKMLGRY